MIKVLHVLTDTNIGGAGRYLFNLLSRVDYSCFEVVVACPGGGELEKQLKSKGIRVFTLEGGESSANFGHIKKLRQIISPLYFHQLLLFEIFVIFYSMCNHIWLYSTLL
jgi:hypothetical protein